MIRMPSFVALLILGLGSASLAQTGPPFNKVSDLLEAHDRALVRDLSEYASTHPKADDLDRALHDPV